MAATPEAGPSPTKMSKTKASEGAARALAASQKALFVHKKTEQALEAAALQDPNLPCVPISPSSLAAEESKASDAVTIAESPYYQGLRKETPTLLGIPPSTDDAEYKELVQSGLRGLSLDHRPLTVQNSWTLAMILTKPSPIRYLDMSRAIDPAAPPPIPSALLEETMDAVADEIGPESNEENVQKLTETLEKMKQEYTTYDAAVEFLAKKRLDRYTKVFDALDVSNTLEDLDLSFNNLGNPNADGRSDFSVIRKLAKVIDGNTTLARLNLRGNRFGPVGTGLIAKAMSKNISVHTLDLGGCDITAEPGDEEEDPEQEEEDPVFGELYQGLEALSELFKKNKFLRCLSLRGNRIKAEIDEAGDDDGADTSLGKLLEPLKKFHRLEILDLSCNELGGAGARMIAANLGPNRSIKVLDLSDNALGPKGLVHMAALLRSSKSITKLVLQQNQLAGSGKTKKARREALAAAEDFGAALRSTTLLKCLNMNGNHFGPELSAAILGGLASSQVSELHFSMNDLCGSHAGEFSDIALSAVVKALGSAPLQELYLSGNFIQAEGMALLANGVQEAPQEGEEEAKQDAEEKPSPLSFLVSLDVARNALGNDGVQPLLAHLGRKDATLKTLDLSFNGLTDSTSLARAIRINTSVKRLELANNELGEGDIEGFRAFMDGIVDRPSVAELGLSSNKLGDSHANAAAYVCRTATEPLQSLNLLDNPSIGLEATQKIVTALKNSQCMRALYVSSQQGDRAELFRTLLQTLEVNKTLSDIDLSFPTNEFEVDMIKKVQTALLRNALRK